MGMRQLWLAILWGMLTGTAQAGPWLRATGEGFLSFSVETPVSDSGPVFSSTYVEYGLSERVTLGFDLGGSEDDLYKAIVFAKTRLGDPEKALKMAMELGVGVTEQDAVLRPGLSVGRGFSLGDWSGWMTIDTLAIFAIETNDIDITTDITVGLNMSTRAKLMLQLQSGYRLMDPDYLKFAPSVVYERKPGQHIELGVLAGIDNAEDIALKLGLWQSF